MFESHLGNEKGEQGHERMAHGRIVRADHVPSHTGGSQGSLDIPPDAKAPTVKGLPREAQNWEGSDTLYRSSELPVSTPDGQGFQGSSATMLASDLEKIDGRSRPDTQLAAEGGQPPAQPMQPGIYQLSDGNVLVVGPRGQQQVISRQQYDDWAQQQQQRQRAPRQEPPPSLMNRVLGSVRR